MARRSPSDGTVRPGSLPARDRSAWRGVGQRGRGHGIAVTRWSNACVAPAARRVATCGVGARPTALGAGVAVGRRTAVAESSPTSRPPSSRDRGRAPAALGDVVAGDGARAGAPPACGWPRAGTSSPCTACSSGGWRVGPRRRPGPGCTTCRPTRCPARRRSTCSTRTPARATPTSRSARTATCARTGWAVAGRRRRRGWPAGRSSPSRRPTSRLGAWRTRQAAGRAVATARSESTAELLCAELAADGLPIDRAGPSGSSPRSSGRGPRRVARPTSSARERDAEVLGHAPAGSRFDLRNPADVRSLLRRIGVEVPDTRAWRLETLQRRPPADRRRC